MVTEKSTCARFLKEEFAPMPEGEKRALFEREVGSLFTKYRKWHRDNFYGKSPSGVKKQLFRKWLLENNCFFVSNKK